MRAIINATGYHDDLLPFVKYRPSPMFKILDKPIIAYIIEFLAKEGIREIDVVLSHLPHLIENYLEEGKRWGVEITYHLLREPQFSYHQLASLPIHAEGEIVMLGQGDSLPLFEFPWLYEVYLKNREASLLFYRNGGWSGWGIFPGSSLQNMANATSPDTFVFPYQTVKAKPYLTIKNLDDLKSMNAQFLHDNKFRQHFPFTARSLDAGIWVGKDCHIHHSAQLIPPVFIGEYCRIGQKAKIGPNAVLENNCLIESNASVENSFIFQRSYVGEGLAVKNCIVDRHHLMNMTMHTYVFIKEEFLLAEVTSPSFQGVFIRFLEKWLAICLITLLSPFYLYFLLWGKWSVRTVMRLPAPPDEELWESYPLLVGEDGGEGFFFYLPMILSIVTGHLHFVGLSPRTIGEVKLLAPEWQTMYRKGKAGLITPLMGKEPSQDELFAAEFDYVANRNFSRDLSLFFRGVGMLLGDLMVNILRFFRKILNLK